MKTTSVLTIAAVAAMTCVNAQDAGAFTNAEKALWIDRHNYFRMTALPFAAGNMLKIKWSDALATAATTEAAGCAAVTGAGMNVHTHSTSATSSVVDMAFKEWAVSAGLSALSKIKAPKVAGEGVGTGVYNSYSQIVWSATNQVGCGFATCPAGKLVVCKYAPVGNGASEPWYIHAPPNTQCPAGTEGKLGLCIVPGDAGNNDIAPIPAGQNAYDVFVSFIGSMHKVLKGETADGGPATGTSASTNPDAAAAAAAGGGGATTAPAAAGATTDATAAATVTTAAPSTTEAATTTTASPTMAPATHGSGASGAMATMAPTAGAGSSAAATPTAAGSTTTTDDTKSIGFSSITSTGSAAASPGTVRAGSSTGTSFTNAASKAGAKSQDAQSTESTKSAGGSGTANNKSSGEDGGGSKFSAAGVAGAIVVGCVMVAGVFVFVSYRKNQRRQRDIMQNGGIMVL